LQQPLRTAIAARSNMATVSIGGLQNLLGGLGLETPIPSYSRANVTSNPLDIGRSYLADIFFNLLEKEEREKIYEAIRWPVNDTGSGDFYLPVSRFVHDEEEDAEDVAMDLMRKVSFFTPFAIYTPVFTQT
jgi:arginyl-tRNA synthetase